MVGWTLIFLAIAVVAGLLGFTILVGTLAVIAKMLFLVFLVLLIVSALGRGVQGKMR